ncbi:MAG: PQQ-like beta-propeller repeat protein [Gemmataceae bacterium]|nr:PQQ-like beta-propeller repeat protein [Gemmataceae bacterium]
MADGGRVVCTPGGARGTLAAFDAATGKVLWRTDGLMDPAMYSSVAVAEVGGARQNVGVTREHLFGVAPADGKVLWKVPFGSSVVVAQTPVVVGGLVYITAAGGTGSRCYRLAAPDRAEKVFSNKVMLNLPGGVAAHAGHVYGYSDGRGWTCQSLRTVEEVWAAKEFPKGTLTIADGRLVLLTEDAGTVALARAAPDDFEVVSRFTLAPQSKKRPPNARVWTVPVVANGRLYLRDQEHLSCFDLRP